MDCFALWSPPVSQPCDGEQRSAMDSVVASLDTHTPAAAFSRNAALLGLLTPFLPSSWQDLLPTSEARQRLQPALDALTAAPSHSWDLPTLARRVHLHPTYFSNLFRDTFGTSPLRYLAQLRYAAPANCFATPPSASARWPPSAATATPSTSPCIPQKHRRLAHRIPRLGRANTSVAPRAHPMRGLQCTPNLPPPEGIGHEAPWNQHRPPRPGNGRSRRPACHRVVGHEDRACRAATERARRQCPDSAVHRGHSRESVASLSSSQPPFAHYIACLLSEP